MDYFEAYAPVVIWSTIRLAINFILLNGWHIEQMSYTITFDQVELKKKVFIEPPRGLCFKDGKDKVLKLIKNLYGLKKAPRALFEKFQDGLLERGLVQSEMDKCLFMKSDMIFLLYLYDKILAGPNAKSIEEDIKGLRIQQDKQCHPFELRDEGEVGDFLGITIGRQKYLKHDQRPQFKLSQPDFKNKVLKESHLDYCNTSKTTSKIVALGLDCYGVPFSENWGYASIIGMVMFPANNYRTEIAYAVH